MLEDAVQQLVRAAPCVEDQHYKLCTHMCSVQVQSCGTFAVDDAFKHTIPNVGRNKMKR